MHIGNLIQQEDLFQLKSSKEILTRDNKTEAISRINETGTVLKHNLPEEQI